jgi:hypothetical protein
MILATSSVDAGRTTMNGRCSALSVYVDQDEPACDSSSDGAVLTFSCPTMDFSSPHAACNGCGFVAWLKDLGRSLTGVVEAVDGGGADSYQQSM